MSNKTEIRLKGVDRDIYEYLKLDEPKSFMLYAGAGSGKTRTLVNVLQEIRSRDLRHFIMSGQRVAIVTYTNAACDEIKDRLHYDPVFHVSTIHSFVWELIEPFSNDIRESLKARLSEQISTLTEKINKARDKAAKTAVKNTRSRDAKVSRLNRLDEISKFTYSPTSNSIKKDALNHAEVISIGADFILNQPLMKKVLTNRFPILLIDESQDTNKALLESFIDTQKTNQSKFSLGLFGDMMQRIYGGGKEDLATSLPSDWKTPEKIINYRSPKRIISLVNQVRSGVDSHFQEAREGALEGIIRLFIVDSDVEDKASTELEIRRQMAQTSLDESWNNLKEVKCLTLEHAMAANRGGFAEFFLPLARVEKLRDAALNGTSREVKFITDQLLPLVRSINADALFETARIVKSFSTLLRSDNPDFLDDPLAVISSADESAEKLKEYLHHNEEASLLEVLKIIHDTRLLEIPDKLLVHIEDVSSSGMQLENTQTEDDELQAWGEALLANINHAHKYSQYISEQLGFSTHQGVKGLEFKRVMAILDDKESKGFLFKYEKLFGAEALSKKDLENESEGIDSAQSRTRRLFYVICSRAEQSLAVVAYSKAPEAVKRTALESNWFKEDEIVLL